jgi:hypothetical protein
MTALFNADLHMTFTTDILLTHVKVDETRKLKVHYARSQRCYANYVCKSDPQIAALLSLTMASVALMMLGRGTSATVTLYALSSHNTARTVALIAAVTLVRAMVRVLDRDCKATLVE